MKLSSSSKPISSPGRAVAVAAKFPPPLMRFLRSNVGSRSRARSRASPLFLRKRRTATATATGTGTETQEPSSPKVTCIGQVRVRRSKNSNPNRRPKGKNKNQCRCRFWKKPSFCSCSCVKCSSISVKKLFRPVWRVLVRFFCCRSAKVQTDSSRNGSNRVVEEEDDEEEDEEEREIEKRETEEIENGSSASVSASAATPPRNALMLTRCRSAPYRSSSLAGRFWGSPLRGGTEEGEAGEGQKTEEESTETPTLENEAGGRDSTSESRGGHRGEETGEGSLGTRAEVEIQSRQGGGELDSINGVSGCSSSPHRMPLMLLRCRSEPVRTGRGEKLLDPLTSQFWRERRLGNTESCTPQSHAVD